MLSTHKVECVKLGRVGRHPNADSLEISTIFNYTVIFKENQFKEGDLVCFVPPDTVMPATPEYDWLGERRLVRAKKLRGIQSFGLVLKAPEGAVEGADYAEHFGAKHYEPQMQAANTGGEAERPPQGYAPVYDVDSGRRYAHVFEEGETVILTEKIHGANGRFKFDSTQDKMYCGSKTEWKRQNDANLWWRALASCPEVEKMCRENPGWVVYGEVAGQVQKGFDYGVPKGESRIFVFDIMVGNSWMPYNELVEVCDKYGVRRPPLVAKLPFDLEAVCNAAEGPSLVPGAKHYREGVVVHPERERSSLEIGRIKVKFISPQYLNKG